MQYLSVTIEQKIPRLPEFLIKKIQMQMIRLISRQPSNHISVLQHHQIVDTTFRLGCNLLLRVINNKFVVLKLSAWGKRRGKKQSDRPQTIENITIDSAKKLLLHYKRIIKFNWQTGHCAKCTTTQLFSVPHCAAAAALLFLLVE